MSAVRKSVLLSLMMFLPYMVLPVWLVPLVPYAQDQPGCGTWGVCCGFLMIFGTITTPAI